MYLLFLCVHIFRTFANYVCVSVHKKRVFFTYYSACIFHYNCFSIYIATANLLKMKKKFYAENMLLLL